MDIVVTWPQDRHFAEYMRAIERARVLNQWVNFRVAKKPKKLNKGDRCYQVYDGKVRGWMTVWGVEERGENEVLDPHTEKYWRPGIYVMRVPNWHSLEDQPEMRGFQGFRYWRGT